MLARALVLRKRAEAAPAEHLVAWLDLRHVRADRLDAARHVDAADGPLRMPQSLGRAKKIRRAPHHVPVVGVHGRGADRDEHAVVVERRPLDLLEPQHLGRAVLAVGDHVHCKSTVDVQRKLVKHVATEPAPVPHPRIPLTRERVLRAAIALADEGGIESLTMRKLAQSLGVEAMSLYNHVANKGDLVGAIVDLVVSEFELPEGGEDWEAAIRRCAISAHDVLVHHPWACSLVLSPSGAPTAHTARMRYIEWLLGRLRDAGFPPELAYHGYHALDSHILGFTLWQLGHTAGAEGRDLDELASDFLEQLPATEFPHLAEHIHQHLAAGNDGKSEFEFGLDLILNGLKRAKHDG